MEQSKLLRVSWILYTVFLIAAMVPTVINMVRPLDWFVGDWYEAYVGESWRVLAAEHPRQATLYKMYCRHAAAVWFSVLVLALSVTVTAYRDGLRWAWVTLIVALVVPNGITAVIHLVLGTMFAVLFWMAWLVTGLVILLLPIKEMLALKRGPALLRPASAFGQVHP